MFYLTAGQSVRTLAWRAVVGILSDQLQPLFHCYYLVSLFFSVWLTVGSPPVMLMVATCWYSVDPPDVNRKCTYFYTYLFPVTSSPFHTLIFLQLCLFFWITFLLIVFSFQFQKTHLWYILLFIINPICVISLTCQCKWNLDSLPLKWNLTLSSNVKYYSCIHLKHSTHRLIAPFQKRRVVEASWNTLDFYFLARLTRNKSDRL